MKHSVITYIASALLLTGCNDGFLDKYPQAINEPTFWNTTDDLRTYANQFYSNLGSGLTCMGDGESDNQVPNAKPSYLWNEQTTPISGGMWGKGDWEPIRKLNYFLTHYQQVNGIEAEINQYVAEVRFFRAQQYGAKIRQFGDVPWLEKELNTSDTDILYGKKTNRKDVLSKIIEDFDFAIQWLPENPTPGRIGKNVARHLKARTCLHEATYYKYHTELNLQSEANQLFEQAASAANEIIKSGKYDIYNTGNPLDDFYQLFLIEDKSSVREVILPVEYKEGVKNHGISRTLYEANTGFSKDFVRSFLCTNGKPTSLSPELYKGDKTIEDEFMNRDPRLKQTILTPDRPRRISENGEINYVAEEELINRFCYTGYNIIKFFSPTTKAFEPNNSTYGGIVYRFAETLLIYAEAKAELGTITQDDLNISINKLRDRVAMPHLSLNVGFTDPNWPEWGYSLSPILQEIRRERRIELGGEGMRFDDLCRWKAGHLCNKTETYLGKWDAENNKYAEVYIGFTGTRKWDDKLYLRPIPTSELLMNPNLLPQNPGWDTVNP